MKEFLSLKLCAILSIVMKSLTVLPHPAWGMSHLFVPSAHTEYPTRPFVT